MTRSEAGTSALNVNVSPDSEVVKGVGEEYPFILRGKIKGGWYKFKQQSTPTSTLSILPVSRA